MGSSVIHGLEELTAKLHDMQLEVGVKLLRSTAMAAAMPWLDELRATAPVGEYSKLVKTKKGSRVMHEPGFLKSRIKRRSAVNKTGGTGGRQNWRKGDVIKVRVGVFTVPYVGHLEFGTSKHAAHPFIRRAAIARQQQVIDAFAPALRTRLKRYEKRIAKGGR